MQKQTCGKGMSEGRKGFYIPGWGTTTYTAWDKKAKQKNLSGEASR